MTHRPNVERAIAQVATWRGRRLKLRYRGEPANHAWLKRRTAALNLRNLLGRGLARRDGSLGAGHLTSRPAAMASGPGKTRPPARQATTPSPCTGCRPDQRAGHGRTAAHRRVMNAHQKRPNSAGS